MSSFENSQESMRQFNVDSQVMHEARKSSLTNLFYMSNSFSLVFL